MDIFIDEALCKAKFQGSSRVLNIKYNDIDFVDGMACKKTKDLSYFAIYNSINTNWHSIHFNMNNNSLRFVVNKSKRF